MISRTSRKEAEDEHHQHHGDDRADLAAGQPGQGFVHQIVAAEAAKHQREEGGTDEDREHHAGDLTGIAGDRGQDLGPEGAPQAGAEAVEKGRGHRRRDDDGDEVGDGQGGAARPQVERLRQHQQRDRGDAGDDIGCRRLRRRLGDPDGAEKDRTGGANRCGLGRRRDAGEDRAQHGDDQQERRGDRDRQLAQRGEAARRVGRALDCRRPGRLQPAYRHLIEEIEPDQHQPGRSAPANSSTMPTEPASYLPSLNIAC